MSTNYNTTPRRWRAPQSNTGNRDRRTTISKDHGVSFLTETLRLRTTCVVRRASKFPSNRTTLVSLDHVGFEEAANEVHLAGVSLPAIQTVSRLALVRVGTRVVRSASQGWCWGNKEVTRTEAIFEREQIAPANSWTPLQYHTA